MVELAHDRFDPQSDGFACDPYLYYESLRRTPGPVFYNGMGGCWLLSRFEDVDHAARDPRFVRSLEAFLTKAQVQKEKQRMNWHDMPNHQQYVQTSLLETDGVIHKGLRLVLQKCLNQGFVQSQRASIQSHVDSLLDNTLQRGELDFITDFAYQVPGLVIGRLIGVPDQDCAQLRAWSEDVVQFFDVNRKDHHKLLAENTVTVFSDYLKSLIHTRRKAPRDDLVSQLITLVEQREISEVQLISSCMLLLMAGHGSTIDVLGTGLHALIRHPDQFKLMAEQPDCIETAVEEMFRYEPPLPFFHRYASEEVSVGGRLFPKGTKFGLLYGSANRDPEVFSKPELFNILRRPNRHLGFGRGPHLCLGNYLARLELEVVFSTLLRRVAGLEILGKPVFRPGLSTRGLQSLPIRVLPK